MLARTLREMSNKQGLSVGQLSKRSGVPEWVIREIESERPSYVPSVGNIRFWINRLLPAATP